ncbi:MAG: hypothetical protein ABEH43_10205, partial [Flavobacteriales bacterium]
MSDSLYNGNNITLFSPRRLGKTGLIHHFFFKNKNKNINTVYLDILGTESLDQFIRQFANSLVYSHTST